MNAPDLRGVTPALVTPFNEDGSVDYDTVVSYTKWLKSIPGVTGVVVNAHAGEGTSLFEEERREIIETVAAKVPDFHIVAGVSGEGTAVVAREAEMAKEAGAHSVLLFPAASWTRFGYQKPAVSDRYRAVYDASELPIILFNWPNTTKATYSLDVLLELCALDGVFAIKDGARDMIRWDVETPIIRQNFPDIQMLTCQDEFLLHTMWESDGALVGYAALIPELMVELLEKAKAHDYDAAKEAYDRMMPITRAVYHRESHMESTMAMKLGLVERGLLKNAIVRSPLMPLEAEARGQVASALKSAGVI
ncbi:4-hydroxy-tetrahydrodipicolinate synthase / 2-keto-6-phosphogluconate aldolase-like protein [Pontimonas salivibrio]|uniref:4-hydroxy-tetrahydrodipicolinate synthase / 2-keto-6-phosphogluconate aldolase-like protein n=1 Tax=Pontimonas salivibrio TaxID=1159327 RepID=A0A2L2BRD7_9MICO|nr:dihydrodipicolinate synthase family protein [Pontimonas salivibrio]AVG24236.1 4-hydroxy-tetrahydrodipicolinate synthase / 2-keto-6-phosphogluconate aldolase-like protein [Pontimonas salivibrio]